MTSYFHELRCENAPRQDLQNYEFTFTAGEFTKNLKAKNTINFFGKK